MLRSINYRPILLRILLGSAATLLASNGAVAAEGAKEEVQAAAKALSEKDNYSWTTSSSITRGDNSFDTEARGMTEKGGFTHLTMPRGDNTLEFVAKAGKGAAKTESGWRSVSELESGSGDENRGRRFLARMIQNFKAPAAEVEELAGKTKDLKKSADNYTAELTEEGAKDLLTFGGRRGGEGPEVKNAKGTVTFVISNGELAKYSYDVEGSVQFQGNESNVRRKVEVQIRDVGTTKLNVPEEAKSKAS